MNPVLDSILTAERIDSLGWTLVHSLWQILLVGVATKAVLALISSRRASLRYATATLGMLLCLAIPGLSALVPLAPQVPSTAPSKTGPLADTIAVHEATVPSSVILVTDDEALSSATPPPPAPTWQERMAPFLPWIVITWLIGVGLFTLRTLLGELLTRRLCRVDCSPVSDQVQALARQCAQRLGLARSVRVLRSGRVQVPVAIGCLKPYVLLPVACLSGLSTKELETILLHELAHIRRADALWNLAQNVVGVILFYHPVVWWLSKTIREERENCCDDMVIAAAGSPATYLRALSQLERLRGPALSMAATDGSLLKRARRMAGVGERPQRASQASWLSFVLVVSTVLATLVILPNEALTQTPEVESLAPMSLEEQRTANEKAYQDSVDYLREVHAKRWVVIVSGRVLASFDKWKEAADAADRMDDQALHRFVFRPGVDDLDEEFVQSPWLNSDPNWFQIGRRLRKAFPLTISPFSWSRKGLEHMTPDGRGQIEIGAPGTRPRVRTKAVCSNMFQQDLTVTERVADALRLDRWAVPGTAMMHMPNGTPCRKAMCRLTLDELEIDALAVAFIIPQAHVSKAPPKPPATILKEAY